MLLGYLDFYAHVAYLYSLRQSGYPTFLQVHIHHSPNCNSNMYLGSTEHSPLDGLFCRRFHPLSSLFIQLGQIYTRFLWKYPDVLLREWYR